MTIISEEMDAKILKGLNHYNEYQVARMYNLRVGAVRAVKMEAADKQLVLNLKGTTTGRMASTHPQYAQLPKVDYKDLENRVWASYCNAQGHSMLDYCNSQGIYNATQLSEALNKTKQINDHIAAMSVQQKLALIGELIKALSNDTINNPSNPSTTI